MTNKAPAEASAAGSVWLEGFEHFQGAHCSSSALRSIAAYDGLQLSEAMAFGLGSGLGFFYHEADTESPSRRFNGRAPDLEGSFYALLGHPLPWLGSWQPERIREALSTGRPLLAQTNIHPIPYYDDAHFVGHGLAIVGLESDVDNTVVYTADIAAADFSCMKLEHLQQALNSHYPPLMTPYHYAVTPSLQTIDVELEELAPQAIAKTVRYMLEPPSASEGIGAMITLADALPDWHSLPDVAWSARFGYQSIEKRGTGGGGFRRLYRDFLAELSPTLALPDDVIYGFERVASMWSRFALHLKEVAYANSTASDSLLSASLLLREIAGLEEALLHQLADAIPQ